jgi:hypothetical protein
MLIRCAVLGKCGHSFHMVRLHPSSPAACGPVELTLTVGLTDFFRIALPFNLDPTRILKRLVSNVSTKYVSNSSDHFCYIEVYSNNI